MLIVSVFLLWILHGTKYTISKSHLIYNCGPISGKIKLQDIKKIEKEKTLWSGLRPATARNGLIIHFSKYDEIYISPKTNETFLKKLLELHPKVIVD
jgi:hypothetical protein